MASARFYLHIGNPPTFNATQSQSEILTATITIEELGIKINKAFQSPILNTCNKVACKGK
jgi:hypothetical protein